MLYGTCAIVCWVILECIFFAETLTKSLKTETGGVKSSAAIAYTDEEALLRQEIEELSDECCSKMSLFYAEATPLLKLISRYATQCHMVDAMIPMDVTSECLAAMAHICRGLLVKPSLRSRVTRDDTLMLLLRVMTGVIILYDHIDPYGVFRKSSKLHSNVLWVDSTVEFVVCSNIFIKDEEETTSVIGMQNASVLHNAAVLLDDDFLSSSCLAFHLALVPEAYVEYQPVPEADTAENLTLAEYHAASVWLYVIHVTQLVMFMSA
ncbi:hypothetical protein Aperf_G00000131534 [Anoplocephala perfoliata]